MLRNHLVGVTYAELLKFQNGVDENRLISHDHSIVAILQMVAQHDTGARTILGKSHIVEVIGRFATRAMGFAALVYLKRTLNQRFVVTGGASQVESHGLHHS